MAEAVVVVGVEVAPVVEEDVMVLVAESPARKDGPDSPVDSSTWCGDQLSPLAKKIPKATRTSDHQETKRRELQRACLVKIVDWACKHESMCPQVWTMITTGAISSTADLDKTEFWAEPPKNLSKRGRAAWLTSQSEGSLSHELLRRMDEKDEHIVKDMFSMFTKSSGTVSLPQEFIEKALLHTAMTLRYTTVAGTSIKDWVAKYVNKSDASVNWSKCGPYKLEASGGRIVKVSHWCCADPIEIPQWQAIGADFIWQRAAYDMQTSLVKAHVSHPLQKLFKKDQGPNLHTFDKKGKMMKALLESAKEEFTAQRQKAKFGHFFERLEVEGPCAGATHGRSQDSPRGVG